MARDSRVLPPEQSQPDRRAEHALYRAIARIAIEASDFTLNTAIPVGRLWQSIVAPSVRRDSKVAGKTMPRNLDIARLSAAVLTRMKEYLDVGAMLPDGTSAEISAAVQERFGDPRVQIRPDELQRYRRFNVIVCLAEDGGVWWEYSQLSGGGEYPPGVGERNYGGTEYSTLHIYLQNLIRAGIQGRLEKMGK